MLGPGNGDQACGEIGDGRMLEADELVEELIAALAAQAAGRPALADHRRPDLRAHRPGARHHQPLAAARWVLRSRAPRARPAPRSPWSPARCTCPRRAACGASTCRRRSRCTTRWCRMRRAVLGVRRHRGGGRLAAGQPVGPEDQEERQQGRADLRADREPRHPGRRGQAAEAPLLRGLRRREPRPAQARPRKAAAARTCR